MMETDQTALKTQSWSLSWMVRDYFLVPGKHSGWKLQLRSDKGRQAPEKNSTHGSENPIHKNNIR